MRPRLTPFTVDSHDHATSLVATYTDAALSTTAATTSLRLARGSGAASAAATGAHASGGYWHTNDRTFSACAVVVHSCPAGYGCVTANDAYGAVSLVAEYSHLSMRWNGSTYTPESRNVEVGVTALLGSS